ncbi:hypothetical protein Trihar35433_8495 [Trichoderma harzianum]|nr:hypothetical protein Trihar35433_8495 [Trichoderma harzianum]
MSGFFSKFRRPASGVVQLSEAAALGPNVLTSIDDAKVDVIFLHGLTGHRERTWTAEGQADPWPKSLLPKDLPTARIITYGYDADVLHLTRVAGQNTVREHAKTLINDLSALRTDTVGRPIIFVVHSLGGLVIQDALLICNNPNDDGQSDILSSTRGVAFLGTPHAGADLERFATAVANVVSLVKKPNKRLLGVLRRNSETLANIKDGFHTMVIRRQSSPKPIELHAFIEEQPVDFLRRRVVEPDSAKIPGYNFETIPANHMDMTKFCTASEVGYGRVVNRLKRWIGDDAIDASGIGDAISMQYKEQLRKILKVEFSASDSPNSIEEICNSSDIEESLEWLLESWEYRNWRQTSSSKLLIHGEQGDGKTVAMSYVLKRLRLESWKWEIASIFCSYGDSELGVVASLAFQLLQKDSSRLKMARQKFPLSKFEPHAQLKATWELLRYSAFEVDTETLIIIDGVDKLDRHVMSSFLQNLRRLEDELKAGYTSKKTEIGPHHTMSGKRYSPTGTDTHPMKVLISSETIDDIMSKLAHYSTIDREKERRECLKTLAFEEWNARESRVEDVEEGGRWLASHTKYTDWSESPTASVLWLEGKPGSGKSTLAKLIVSKLENGDHSLSMEQQNKAPMERRVWTFDNPTDKSAMVARFYYSFRGGNIETRHELMLRSIVYQIWRGNSRLYKLLKSRYHELQKSRGDADKSGWSYEDLKSALRSLHQIDFFMKIVIVVDGMDESDSDRRADVLRFLPSLAVPNSKCIIKVLIASRPESDINFRLRRACSHHIKLQDVNEEDIRLVVEKRIEQMEVERNCKPNTFEVVKNYILKESSGVFLWVTLVLREMERCLDNGLSSKADLNRIVLQLPKELGGEHGFYKRMILPLSTNREEDLYQQARGRRIFYWVTFPKRPISATELQDVLATPLPSQEKNLSSYNFLDNRPLELDRGILLACGGLVEVRDSYLGKIVQLIHQTAREFLLQKVAEPYHLTEAGGDVEIATTCCQIICIVFSAPILQQEAEDSLSQAKVLSEHLSSYPLLVYALTNFSKHLDHIEDGDKEVILQFETFTTKLSARPNSYACVLLSQWITSNLPKKLHVNSNNAAMRSCIHATLSNAIGSEKNYLTQILMALQPNLLCLEIEAGHFQTTELLLDCDIDPNGRDNNGQTPLSLAVSELDIEDDNGRTAFFLAVKYNHLNVIKLLLECGSKPNVKDSDGQTPLLLAYKDQRLDLVKLLLKCGTNPNVKDSDGQTPLLLAYKDQHLDLVKLLLECGSNPNVKDSDGQTPLLLAYKDQHLDLVKLLLKYSSNPNVKDSDGQTPLLLAIKDQRLDLVKLLLECGSKIKVKDNDGQTPFFLAITHRHFGIAELLLEHGSSVFEKDDNGQTIFSLATEHGYKDFAKKLRQRELDMLSKSTKA